MGSDSHLPVRILAVESCSGKNTRTKAICSTSNDNYSIAEIDPIHIKLNKKHLFVLVLVCLLARSVFFHFFIFYLTDYLVKMLQRFNFDELVRAIEPGIWYGHPKDEANNRVIKAELKFGEEEQRDHHDPSNG